MQHGQHPFQHRSALGVQPVSQPFELLRTAQTGLGKALAKRHLFGPQDVHGKMAGLKQQGVHTRLLRHIERNERRIQRNAGKRADRNAPHFTAGGRRDHGHGRGHPPHHLSQGFSKSWCGHVRHQRKASLKRLKKERRPSSRRGWKEGACRRRSRICRSSSVSSVGVHT